MSKEKYIDGRDINKGNVKKCTKKNNDEQENINKIYFVVKKKILKKELHKTYVEKENFLLEYKLKKRSNIITIWKRSKKKTKYIKNKIKIKKII